MTDDSHTKRVALVTGGSGGIGRGICLRLAEAGLAVAVHGHASIERPRVVRDELRAAGARAEAYRADLSSEEEVERLFADVLRDFGQLDCLVSNAGIFPRSTIVDMQTDEWDRVLGVNLRGTFLTCRAMARHLTDRQIGSAGRIVTISSGSALRGMPRGAHYSASKAAVIGFTKSLAQELAPGRTLVNCIAPGTVDTRMPRIDATEEFLAERSRTVVPLGRIGQPADIAEVVAFLVDERVTWLTGQTIWVNGGELLP